MNRQLESPAKDVITSFLVRCGLAFLLVFAWLTATATGQTQIENSLVSSPIRVTHILGFEDVRRNTSGELSIDASDLRFRKEGGPATHVSIPSIQNISVGEQDKQVGGKPMMLGKAAVPFGGGRVVSLFSHKKSDSFAIEYLDSKGGIHGAVFSLSKGQGEILMNALVAHGAHIVESEHLVVVQTKSDEPQQHLKWSVQVDTVDPGDTSLDSSFSYAVYENLLRDLAKSKQFEQVFRSGDRTASDVSGVLILKTVVKKYFAGSETRRAVTTITGATKLKVHIQLVTRDGQVIMERDVEGDVRFMGENLKATDKVASKTAKVLKKSAWPAPAAPRLPQTSATAAGGGL